MFSLFKRYVFLPHFRRRPAAPDNGFGKRMASISRTRDIRVRLSRPLVLFGLAMMLGGCVSRPTEAVLRPVPVTSAQDHQVTVYVVTTRSPTKDGIGFSSGKSFETRYMAYTISIPPSHKPGQIEYPGRKPDPQTAFTVVKTQSYSRPAFLAEVKARRTPDQDIGVFVHGYNYNFQESLFRLAQITADAHKAQLPVLFAWPSAAEVTGYLADKDSAAFSRDQLAQLLEDLSRSNGSEVSVLGHSMGGWLTMEALRQMRLAGHDGELNRLLVVLAAPDIDINLFRMQLKDVGRLNKPIILLVSQDDRALAFSAFLADDQRVGAVDINDPRVQAAAKEANVQIVDISDLASDDPANHSRFAELAASYPKLKADSRKAGFLQAGVFVFNSVGQTLVAPLRIAGHAAAATH